MQTVEDLIEEIQQVLAYLQTNSQSYELCANDQLKMYELILSRGLHLKLLKAFDCDPGMLPWVMEHFAGLGHKLSKYCRPGQGQILILVESDTVA